MCLQIARKYKYGCLESVDTQKNKVKRGTPGKRVIGKTDSGVRIPLSPQMSPVSEMLTGLFCMIGLVSKRKIFLFIIRQTLRFDG